MSDKECIYEKTLKAPLFTDWTEQYVRVHVPDVEVGDPFKLQINGEPVPFQYTGSTTDAGAQILLRLGFETDETKTLRFLESDHKDTDLFCQEIPLSGGVEIGREGSSLRIPEPEPIDGGVEGPFAGFADRPYASEIHTDKAFQSAKLQRINAGPLFEEYELKYQFEDQRCYQLTSRCYRHDPYVEISEDLALDLPGELIWTWNPDADFDRIVSHRGPEFGGEPQPVIEKLGREDRPRDVLCRLQMPPLGEYFVPNNRGWFGFFDSEDETKGMIGLVGLYGGKWRNPVDNMPVIYDRKKRVEWHASLNSGSRHYLLYAGAVEKSFTEDRRLIFHRLQAEFNALRLDEHLDLTGEEIFDRTAWDRDAMFVGEDFRETAKAKIDRLPQLQRAQEKLEEGPPEKKHLHYATFRALCKPSEETHRILYELLEDRFQLWVRQFQGYRRGESDYAKNVIGFARKLRKMLTAYELLRKDEWLDEDQLRKLSAYFVFAARRIKDEGRWPHSRTFLHPDHPESVRDFYTYGGEHKPDRLVWTNSLPNFQSDPLCALAHLSVIFPDHPDSESWLRKGTEEIERQFEAYAGVSGAWEESINYALASFFRYYITFRALKHRAGIDYFHWEPVRRFVDWLCRFFGPFDKRFGVATWPGVGNAKLPDLASTYLLSFAGELDPQDPLRHDCIAVYQKQGERAILAEQGPTVFAGMAPVPETEHELLKLTSEHMDELGVAMRHVHGTERESYLFQKIGFWKDHYENDESSFNWYAKGTPLTMDYGTYTRDVSKARCHNLVEIPDMDSLRRGYLADHLFSPLLDFTHSEMPVTLKLLWGRMRTFEEIDGKHVNVVRENTPYFYIGDKNPVGPKIWKVRSLLFVKPDYIALFDRVYGDVPHRYNLHVTADDIQRNGRRITAPGRFDLNLEALVQHPVEFETETGSFVPDGGKPPEEMTPHGQSFFRIYNRMDGIYRTLLFAREPGQEVTLEPWGNYGMKTETLNFTDYVFMHDERIEQAHGSTCFAGRTGWIRRRDDGQVQACLIDGDEIGAFGTRLKGEGPWMYNVEGTERVDLYGGPPREIQVETV
ncbi:MAG: hypothetical protein ACLFWL_12810 [Candidatus Brocadiia bacterium]